MDLFSALFGRNEQRSLENPTVNLADSSAWTAIFGDYSSAAGEAVNVNTAMGVPAIFAAVNAISGTIASLPLHYLKSDGEKADKDPLYRIVHDVVNADGLTSFHWRKWLIKTLLLTGRAFSFIERNKAGRVMGLWPLETSKMSVARVGGRKVYTYRRHDGTAVSYTASEIIDLILTPGDDDLTHVDPLLVNRNSIGLMIAAEKHAGAYFAAGAIPPLVLNGPPLSPQAASRVSATMEDALKAASGKRNVIVTPAGYSLQAVGLEPGKSQLLETRQWMISEVARIFNIPPSFIQDHSRSTFGNVEHQDLAYSKHTILPLVLLIEQELNSKLFVNWVNTIKFKMEGLERGDFATRMTAYQSGIHSGLYTPNEARALEGRPPLPGGDDLMIQGATQKIKDQGGTEPATQEAPDEAPADDAAAEEEA